MNSLRLRFRFAAASIAVVLLAGCGGLEQAQNGAQPPIAAPNALRQTSAVYTIIHRFAGGSRPAYPFTGVIGVGGKLYGTTFGPKSGNVYSMSRSGTMTKVLHRFSGYPDGSGPWGGNLIDVNGTLYGTTYYGGAHAKGTVFSVTTSGVETVVYSFAGASDGANPFFMTLLDVNGTLYGTTLTGGGTGCSNTISHTEGCGTVFSITPSGSEQVLYRFKGGSDGASPSAGVIDVNGTLYGTTEYGGSTSTCKGCGTVYSITPSGSETVLHSFAGGGTDGANPQAPLLDVKGILYGTTADGGSCSSRGSCGTVYSITTDGKEKVIYAFQGGSDGASPLGSMAYVKGIFYGTTYAAGSSSCSGSSPPGCGTVFGVSKDGTESVLHSFAGGKDGSVSISGVISLAGTLYGTTTEGGNSRCSADGCGTVFTLTP